MGPIDDVGADTLRVSATDGGVNTSWRWATVLAVHPVLTAGALFGAVLFGLGSAATTAFNLPKFLPLFLGALTLLFLGGAHLYTPVYLAGLALDRRRVRATDAVWGQSGLVVSGGGAQAVYVLVPIVQAYGGATFEELVFGSIEFAALLFAGVVTVRHLAIRDNNMPGAPGIVSLWSSVWSRVARA